MAPALHWAFGNSRASPSLSSYCTCLTVRNYPTRASLSDRVIPTPSYPMSKYPSLFDSWAKRDVWRRNPVFSNRAMFSNLFPGFGIAVVAFSVYVLTENVLGKGKHQAVENKSH
jgi:NADH dehydrogenase (ubiquinone) 1 beta subcomplex subunit 3